LWLPVHVAPTAEQGAYRITFSELGRPPAYSGKTGLTIRPQERRVLLLPMVDLGDQAIWRLSFSFGTKPQMRTAIKR
jgi:hypothetical protein